MRTGICSVAVLIGAMGIVTDVAAVPENNSSLAPLIFPNPPHNLLAGDTASNQSAPIASDALIANVQTLLDQVKSDLNLTQGEVNMFIADMPNVPPQNLPVMIAQANQAQQGDVKTTRTLGVCFPAPNESYSLENVIDPRAEAQAYLRNYEHRTVTGSVTTTVLQQPKHGILRLETEANHFGSGIFDPTNPGYAYLPENGYEGKDRATVLVEIGDIKVKVEYFFQAISGVLGNTGSTDRCRNTGPYWKISSTNDANGNSTITSNNRGQTTVSAVDVIERVG